MIRGLSSCQPMLAEAGDEIGSSSPAKVRLAGAEFQPFKKNSTQKRGAILIKQDGAPFTSYFNFLFCCFTAF
ncbi:Hypothetical protein TPAS_1105 [Trichococcus pasteurii]|uniref:Uncharacterized protein n=1 Tax=Trichococcus pasteurii TaxID=43064 RepID=A0A1W1IEX5_9LACT|nr:hypothetical protein SAMN04488086_101299 [Trichococcus pasteurii]SLM51429.1 Hypothetical protein TPAS_1105 [Trichococcus pasteurii]SSB92310.1 Hypothetical protein TPAS_1105 [Trichococcus pasteurii]